jgi:hypothetical protein
MDVSSIPFAVSFPDFIRQAICSSKVLIALIGAQWQAKIRQPDDPVRMELEVAFANQIPVLPVLIGNTPMPNAEELPESLANIARQNAVIVGVLQDFYTHMQSLLPKLEAILGALAKENVVTSDPEVINVVCRAIIQFLKNEFERVDIGRFLGAEWKTIGPEQFLDGAPPDTAVTLYLHRIARLAELLELHFILSFWWRNPGAVYRVAGWTLRQFEQTPSIPNEFLRRSDAEELRYEVKIRHSDEDPRQIWKMITDQPLRLSLAYVATVSPKTCGIGTRDPSASSLPGISR